MARYEWRSVRALQLHALATQLLTHANTAHLFPIGSKAESIEILADGTVVAGSRTFLQAIRSRKTRVRVVVLPDLTDEDSLVVAGEVIKDVLASTTDPIATGTAWAAFRRFCESAGRPRKGYAKMKYEQRFGVSPVERRDQITRDTFGLSDDQLRRLEAVLPLPVALHDALRARAVPLKSLVALATHPRSVIAAVVADMKAGMAPSEALARHLPLCEDRPEAPTVLRRLLRADDQAVTDLADRVNKIGYLTDADRARIERGRDLHDALLRLPTEREVQEHIARILRRTSGGEEAA